MANNNLSAARKAKNDEFYTQYHDIEKEINAYLEYDKNAFKNGVVLLPCDDPEWSNFTKYFVQNFKRLGLKKLISTSYAPNSKPHKDYQPGLFELESPNYDPEKNPVHGKVFTLEHDITGDGQINLADLEWEYLDGDGDFRSEEVKRLRDDATHIVTNPPFSLFREFVEWAYIGGKKISLIGNMNAITYKEMFPLIKENKMWLGATNFNTGMYFLVPKNFEYADTYKFEKEIGGKKASRVPGVCWFTNIDHGRRHEPLSLMTMAENIKFSKHKEINGIGYKKYDNYDAIEVPYSDSIPSDYKGIMGVPITFLGKYNPDQFEVIDLNPHFFEMVKQGLPKLKQLKLSGQKDPYARVLIKHKLKKNSK